MEFGESAWHELRRHSAERGLLFLSSPFSLEAVELLCRVGVAAWKIPSGEVGNTAMLERVLETGLPVLLSTGMSGLEEIDAAVELSERRNVSPVVLQCTTDYPCPPERVGLNMLGFFRQRYGCRVGLSDHSGTIFPGLAAATMGASVLEVHVTLSREAFGPDVTASVTTGELRQLVDGVRFIERALASPVDKESIASELAPVRALFTKSIVARTDLAAGTILRPEYLAVKKPGNGIPAARLPELTGVRLQRDVKADEPLLEEDLERAS
jgi:N-acetylneuraminate synthase